MSSTFGSGERTWRCHLRGRVQIVLFDEPAIVPANRAILPDEAHIQCRIVHQAPAQPGRYGLVDLCCVAAQNAEVIAGEHSVEHSLTIAKSLSQFS